MDGNAGHILVVLLIALLEIAGKLEGEIAGDVVDFHAGLIVDEGCVHSHRADLTCADTGHELLPEITRRTEQALVVQIGHRAEGQVQFLDLDCLLHFLGLDCGLGIIGDEIRVDLVAANKNARSGCGLVIHSFRHGSSDCHGGFYSSIARYRITE